MLRGFLLTLLLVCTGSALLQAQEVTRQDLYWIKFKVGYEVNDRIKLTYIIEDRNYLWSTRSNHFINYVSGDYKLSDNFNAGVGYMYFILSLPQDPEQDFSFNKPEHRPIQYIKYTSKISSNDRWSVSGRFMTEQRFRENQNDGSNGNRYDLEFRYRTKLELKYRLVESDQPLDVFVFDEIIYHHGEGIDRTFDQNRLSLGMNWKFSELFGTTLSYLHWYQGRGEEDFYQRDIINLALNLSL